MKVEIYAKPMFVFEIERANVEHLLLLTRNHYDHRCKMENAKLCETMLRLADFAYYEKEGKAPMIRFEMTFSQMDLMAKLVELYIPGITRATWQNSFARALYAAMNHSSEISANWKGGIEV